MGAKHLSDETRKSIVRLRHDGYAMKQIAEILSVNPSTVNTVCLRHRKRSAAPVHIEQIVQPVQAVQVDDTDWHARCMELTDRCLELNDENIKLKSDITMLKSVINRLL